MYTPSIGLVAFLTFVISGVYVHFRGRERLKPLKQLFNHSTFMAPVNCILYMFSRVPKQPFCPVDTFPELSLLQKNWELIRDEALALESESRIVAAEGYTDAGFNSFFKFGWKRFYLKWYGNDLTSARRLCPKTCTLLDQIPSVKAAMFASLPPGSRLTKHRDPYAGSMRYHLGLVTPADPACSIVVDGESYYWRDGEGVVFDETFIHHAANKTEKPRIVLFCDVRRPLWFAPARWFDAVFSRIVMGAAVSSNAEEDRIGGLNKFFARIYGVRKIAKELKHRNRTLYYGIKYLIFALVVYLLLF